jgi:hypothetical protein
MVFKLNRIRNTMELKKGAQEKLFFFNIEDYRSICQAGGVI